MFLVEESENLVLSETILNQVEALVGHVFQVPALLVQALTHSSHANERNSGVTVSLHNERLEFLGDAVLGLVVAQELMSRFPNASEGDLSRWRSTLVSRNTLSEIAARLCLGDFLLLGKGEKRTGGSEKGSILAASFESLIGALFLDGGLEACRRFLVHQLGSWFTRLEVDGEDALRKLDKKTHLQEKAQGRYRATPVYRLVESWGLEHEKYFRVEILIDGKAITQGDGRSKKQAEQDAASKALEILGF